MSGFSDKELAVKEERVCFVVRDNRIDLLIKRDFSVSNGRIANDARTSSDTGD